MTDANMYSYIMAHLLQKHYMQILITAPQEHRKEGHIKHHYDKKVS